MFRVIVILFMLGGVLVLADWVISVPSSCYGIGQSAKEPFYERETCAPFNGPLIDQMQAALLWLLGVLEEHAQAVITLSTVVIALFTLTLWRTTSRLLKTADRQNADMRESLRIATRAADAAHESAEAARRQSESYRLSERAYVKMFHISPGIRVEPDGKLWIAMQMKNWGRTPARITDVVTNRRPLTEAGALPERPSYDLPAASERLAAFLVPGEEFFFSESAGHISDFENATLCFYGYVDYIDAFDQRHRAGYGGLWEQKQDQRERYTNDERYRTRNNLILVPTDAYNYDRPRVRGEGSDWA